MDGLIAAAEPDPNGGVMLADRFLNHNFDRVYSGLYYQITRGQPAAGRFRARCSTGRSIRSTRRARARSPGATRWDRKTSSLRVVSRRVDLTPDSSSDADYTFLVAGDMSEVERQTRNSTPPCSGRSCFWALGLIAAILVQVKVGLLPLRQVSKSAGANPRRRGAAAGRTFSHRDRAAGHRTQFADPAQRGSGGPRPHPCLQSGAFSQDAAVGAGGGSRGA